MSMENARKKILLEVFLAGLIDRAYEKTGRQVVVIIDEYDAPLLDVLHEKEVLTEMREVMQEFYQRLKKPMSNT